MKKTKNASPSASLLEKAEEQLKKEKDLKTWAFTNDGIQKLVHELQVHQVELEMQNEQLRVAEEQARINAEKYIELFDFFPAGYFTLHLNGTIAELNFLGARILGRDRADLINRGFKSFLTADSRYAFDRFLQQIVDQKTKQSCEVMLMAHGKPSTFLHLEGLISEGEEKCFLTAVDITEYKQKNEIIRESEIRYRRLFESAKDGILILDAVSGEILDANPYLVKLIGYSYEELLGKVLWEVGTFKNIGFSQFAFNDLQTKGFIRYDDMPLVKKEGEMINVEFVGHIYVANHSKVIQCNIRDITERKRLEKALRESETRLRELNTTKDKFFSIIAHDLRGPFNSIMGFSEVLLERTAQNDYEEVDKYATIILQSSQRAMDLLTNLLEWSRSQIGRMQFHPENIDFAALVQSMIRLLKDSARQKSIEIEVEVPPGVTVVADKSMMGTIMRNLLSNAIKFTRPGGEIVVSVHQEEKQVIIMVADNGVGIKKEVMGKLFTLDESYSTPGTEEEKGTGLGLILCKEFIERHGGEIHVESEPGMGSRFYFTIPLEIKQPLTFSNGSSNNN